jgi:hypothetical protein
MVQELSRLGDYSVEAKAIRETLELVTLGSPTTTPCQ